MVARDISGLIPITLAPRVALATVIARAPRSTLLQCRHETRDVAPDISGLIPITLAPRVALATVIVRVTRGTLLQCWHETRDGCDSRHLGIPITLAPPSQARYSARTHPEAYVSELKIHNFVFFELANLTNKKSSLISNI